MHQNSKHINEPRHDKTNKMCVRPAKNQISLGIHPVWSESLLCAQWVAKDPSFLHADSEDSGQTGRMPRLIWVFAGCSHFVGFVMSRLKSTSTSDIAQDEQPKASFEGRMWDLIVSVSDHCLSFYFSLTETLEQQKSNSWTPVGPTSSILGGVKIVTTTKQLIEKSRECHNHKP